MSESNALYRVQFICHSERYEVYVALLLKSGNYLSSR